MKLNLEQFYKTTNDVENTPNMFSTKEIPRNAGEVWFYHAGNFMFSDLSFGARSVAASNQREREGGRANKIDTNCFNSFLGLNK